jgi:hypothetical protein
MIRLRRKIPLSPNILNSPEVFVRFSFSFAEIYFKADVKMKINLSASEGIKNV